MSTVHASAERLATENQPRAQEPQNTRRSIAGIAFASTVWVALLTLVSIQQFKVPEPLPEAISQERFSARRAFGHVVELAKAPRPPGSQGSVHALHYLQQQFSDAGIKTGTFEGTMIKRDLAADVINLVATLTGTHPDEPAVLLVAHYDSVPNGPGASDDASGVAVVLETMKTLQAAGPHRRTVTALFTDDEEAGSLGAKLFAERGDLTKEVGVVLNFEARGATGPALIFETSGAQSDLLRTAAAHAKSCIAGSFSNDAYDLMPYDTDLTVFKKRNISGLNFSFYDGVVHYHSRHDSPEMLNLGSLQMEGECAVALARNLSEQRPVPVSRDPVTYFRIAGLPPVVYREAWAYWADGLAALAVLSSVIAAAVRKRIRLQRTVMAFLGCAVSAGVIAVASRYVWQLLAAVHPTYRAFPDETYQAWIYWTALICFAVTAFGTFYTIARKFLSVDEMWAAMLFMCGVLNIGLLKMAPNSTYLLTWPILAGVIAFVATPLAGRVPLRQELVVFLSAVLPILFLVPAILLFLYGLSLGSIQGPIALVVLLLGLLIPQLESIRRWRPWSLPCVAAATFVICCVTGHYIVRPSPAQKQPDNLFYAECSGCGGAVWGTLDPYLDPWTSRFVSERPGVGPCRAFLPGSSRSCQYSTAPLVEVPSPSVTLMARETGESSSVLRFEVGSRRNAETLFIEAEPEQAVLSSEINSKKVDGRRAYGRYMVRYQGNTERMMLNYTIKSGAAVTLRVTDLSRGLPAVPGGPSLRRPEFLDSSNDLWSDALLVTSLYQF